MPRAFHRSAILSIVILLAVLILVPPLSALAHDIPGDVTIQAFLKPAGDRMNLLVRVPLYSMRDIDFPQRGPGYLDLLRAEPFLRDAAKVWISDALTLWENSARVPNPRVVSCRVSLQSDRSFASYDQALSHVRSTPLPNETEVYWKQAMLDVLYEYDIQSERSSFSIQTGLARLGLRVVTVLRFVTPEGKVRAFEFVGDPGLLRLDPRWHQVALRFIQAGFCHILTGTDHLLFLFCLVIPIRRFRSLVLAITSFTAAHSITLVASAFDLGPSALWFPALIETLVAISIVWLALANIVGSKGLHYRWLAAFGFGLVHGFAFSFGLRESLQFAGAHLLTSLLSFNIGVELGQVLVLLLLIPVIEAVFRFVVAERMGTIVLSALAAHTAWHWMQERAARLSQFRWEWQDIVGSNPVSVIGWLMLVVILAALLCCLPWLRRIRFPFSIGTIAQTNHMHSSKSGGEI